MAAKPTPEGKTILLLSLIIDELGGVRNWSEKTEWQRIANELGNLEGKTITAHAARLQYGALKEKVKVAASEDPAKKQTTKRASAKRNLRRIKRLPSGKSATTKRT
jgi:hypothetical protein